MDSTRIKKLAKIAGFDLCGVCSPQVDQKAQKQFFGWIESGYHGDMNWIAKEPDRRSDPSKILPEVKSIIMLGLNYNQPVSEDRPSECGEVSRYAFGRDYHKVISGLTKKLIRSIVEEFEPDESPTFRWFVDFGPFFERTYTEQAGLGFIGKNGMLINREFGSFVFLAEILTDLNLEPDQRDPISHGQCGSCRACIEACPTEAIISPRKIDSRKCISYLTIERPDNIEPELAEKMGNWLFGCDICQTVCPHNKDKPVTNCDDLKSPKGVGQFIRLDLIDQLETREQFLELTAGTPLTRPRLEGLKRNAEIVRQNQRRTQK